jgi:hypothetical protein
MKKIIASILILMLFLAACSNMEEPEEAENTNYPDVLEGLYMSYYPARIIENTSKSILILEILPGEYNITEREESHVFIAGDIIKATFQHGNPHYDYINEGDEVFLQVEGGGLHSYDFTTTPILVPYASLLFLNEDGRVIHIDR